MAIQRQNLRPTLAEEPRDARGTAATREVEAADEVIYRLGLHCLPVPGLPVETSIGDVAVEFMRGPVRAQQTAMRQRHGLPLVFDNNMARRELGESEVVAVFLINEAPIPAELDRAFGRWRGRASPRRDFSAPYSTSGSPVRSFSRMRFY